MDFLLKIAGLAFAVSCQYPETEAFCREYIAEGCAPDFEIRIAPDDIERAMEDGSTGARHSLKYGERLALEREIARLLARRDGLLMHGAAIEYGGEGYIFAAPSGTGKSTHISLWRKYLGEAATIVNGDKPFIRAEGTEFRVYGAPWCGKEGWQTNVSAPVRAVCFLSQARENRIRAIDPGETLPLLYRQIWFPDDAERAGRVLGLLGRMLEDVKFYEMDCDVSEEALRTSYEALTGEKYQA